VSGKIELTVGDVNDVEARVYAHFSGEGLIRLTGTLRGPYCETARTLPAGIAFRPAEGRRAVTAEVCVPDPCVRTPDVPH
jgi:hypothetical protein